MNEGLIFKLDKQNVILYNNTRPVKTISIWPCCTFIILFSKSLKRLKLIFALPHSLYAPHSTIKKQNPKINVFGALNSNNFFFANRRIW